MDIDMDAGQCSNPRPHQRVRHNSFDSTYQSNGTSVPQDKLFGEYTVLDALGRGDFGTVWKVKHNLDSRIYAVKQFHKKFRGETDKQRKLQEVYAQSACVQCPHVVRYYESWIDNATLYMRMEYCDGGSLNHAMPLGHYLWAEEELWDVLYQVSLGLHALHARNIVHLDVKLDNVYLKTVRGRRVYKIGDFGLVRSAGDVAESWIGFNDDEGDKRYLCPVYLSRNTHWKEADVFALAMSVYEVASGVPVPTQGVEYQNVRRSILPGIDHLSADLVSLLRDMLLPNPSHRPTAFDVVRRCAPHLTVCTGGGTCSEWYSERDNLFGNASTTSSC